MNATFSCLHPSPVTHLVFSTLRREVRPLEAELESRRQAWLADGGSEDSFEAMRTEIEAEILRERAAERRKLAARVRDYL